MAGRPVLLALILVTFAATESQQAAVSHISIRTADQFGAIIPQAQVEIRTPGDETVTLIKANADGKADVDLAQGHYQLIVSYPAFCPYKDSLEVQSRSNLTIQAVLKLDSCPGPCRTACIDVVPAKISSPVLKVIVVDTTGARIPGADIQIRSDLDTFLVETRTDEQGEAELTLTQSRYGIHVRAPGFKRWRSTIDLTPGNDRSIKAELKVGEVYGPTVVDDSKIFEPEHYAPLVELPYLPFNSITLGARPHGSRPRR